MFWSACFIWLVLKVCWLSSMIRDIPLRR